MATHECYYAGMRRLPSPLLVLIILIALPVAIPIAIVSWVWDRRRMQAAAERTVCEHCGATLGDASLRLADAEWAKRVAAMQSARPTIRFRMIRSLWAICAACGAEYDYDFDTRMFRHLAREPGDQGKVGAAPASGFSDRHPHKTLQSGPSEGPSQ